MKKVLLSLVIVSSVVGNCLAFTIPQGNDESTVTSPTDKVRDSVNAAVSTANSTVKNALGSAVNTVTKNKADAQAALSLQGQLMDVFRPQGSQKEAVIKQIAKINHELSVLLDMVNSK